MNVSYPSKVLNRSQATDNPAGSMIGMGLLLVALLGTMANRYIKPIHIDAQGGRPLDEREMVLSNNAYTKGLAVPASFGPLLCVYMVLAIPAHWWVPSREGDWMLLMELALVWFIGMPIAFANWLSPAPIEEEDDQ